MKSEKRESKLENHEECIFEMDDLDQATKQMQSIQLSGVDGVQTKNATQRQNEKSLSSLKSRESNDKEDEIEITMSESEGEDSIEPRSQTIGDKETAVGLKEKGCLNSTSVTAVQSVVYRCAFMLLYAKVTNILIFVCLHSN